MEEQKVHKRLTLELRITSDFQMALSFLQKPWRDGERVIREKFIAGEE